MECGHVKFRVTSKAFGGKIVTEILVHKSIVDYSDPAEMPATLWQGLEIIRTYVDYKYILNYQWVVSVALSIASTRPCM